MKQRGRRSASSLVPVDIGGGSLTLKVPPGLSAAERGVFVATVGSKAADWFGTEHVPVLVEYCRHVCRGHVLAAQLAKFDDAMLDTEEGLRRYDSLSAIATRTAGMIARLSTIMRITHQSVWRPDRAANKVSKGNLWQREEERKAA